MMARRFKKTVTLAFVMAESGIVHRKNVHQFVLLGVTVILSHLTERNTISRELVHMFSPRVNWMAMDIQLQFRMVRTIILFSNYFISIFYF